MCRRLCPLALTLALAACGGSSLQDDADRAASVAAEGALVAQGAAEGSSTETFTRVHAQALRGQVAPLERRPRIGRIAREIVRQLERLAAEPGDDRSAARVERSLRRAAESAERLAR